MNKWRVDQKAHKAYGLDASDWHATVSRSNTPSHARGEVMMLQFSSNATIRTEEGAQLMVEAIVNALNDFDEKQAG